MSDAVRDAPWRLVPTEALPGAAAMAFDEVAAETAAEGGVRTARIYRWNPPTLSLGYAQDPETVDWAACERLGVDVVRRRTGGGAILHDGDVSYSLVVASGDVPEGVSEAYCRLLEPVRDAFDRLGVPVEFAEEAGEAVHEPACYLRERHPAHDLVVDGRKVCGNAQHRTKEAVVQHGSVSVEPSDERRAAVLAGADKAAFAERTASLDEFGVTPEGFADALEAAIAAWADPERAGWTDAERARAEELAAGKYDSEAWNRRREA